MKFKATCYPSVNEFDCGEVEADNIKDAKREFQAISDVNYGFLVLDEDIEEIEEDNKGVLKE